VTTFVDTSALYAVLDAADEDHPAARGEWQRLLESGESLRTTNYVLVECCALVQNRLGMHGLQTFVTDVSPILQSEWIDEADHNAGIQAVLAAGQRRLSLVDCTSFLVMRRLGIEDAFTFDRHFQAQGFGMVPRPTAPEPPAAANE
jgi:uncharacterized protein